MRRTFLLLLCCLVAARQASAQKKAGIPGTARVFVYSDIALGAGDPWAFRAAVHCLFQKHHEIGIGYNSYWRKGHNVPDGSPRAVPYGGLSLSSYPQDHLSGVAITYAYVLSPKRADNYLRYLLRAGIFYGGRSDPYNVVFHDGIIGTYHTFDQDKTPAAALLLQPTLNITPGKAIGLTAAIYAILNKNYRGGGIMPGIQVGKVGNHGRYHSPESIRRHQQKLNVWRKKESRK